MSMLSRDQYEASLRLIDSYRAVDPTPESRYGKRLLELVALVEEYEAAHLSEWVKSVQHPPRTTP